MLVTTPAFTVEYRPAYKVNNTTETVFGLLNSVAEKDTPIKESKLMFKRFVEHVAQVRVNPRELITESINKFLEVRKDQYGVLSMTPSGIYQKRKGLKCHLNSIHSIENKKL